MKRFFEVLFSLLILSGLLISPSFASKPEDSKPQDLSRMESVLSILGTDCAILNNSFEGYNWYEKPEYSYCFKTSNEFDDSFALFDSEQHLVFYDATVDYATRIRQGKDMGNSFNSVEELILFMETYLIPETYEPVYIHKSEFVDYELYEYQKLLPNGSHDAYDRYTFFISRDMCDLYFFGYMGMSSFSKEDFSCTTVSALEARQTAFPDDPTCTATYTTKRLCDINPGFSTDTAIRFVYEVFSNGITKYVDAISGDILGETFLCATGGVVASSDSYFSSYSYYLANNAKNKLINMGYSTSSVLSNNFSTAFPSYIGNAFFAYGHGTTTWMSATTSSTNGFYYHQVPLGNYRFVFLAGCSTGASTYWSNAFNIDNTVSGRVFLGWGNDVNHNYNYTVSMYIFSNMATNKTIQTIVSNAIYYSGGYSPLNIYGDGTYNGYA